VGIDLLWQVRTRIEKNSLCILDFNGEVIETMSRKNAIYPPVFSSAGQVPVNDSFVEFCGAERLEETISAVMRHMVRFAVLGIGDDLSSIVEWYKDMQGASYLDGKSFKIERGIGVFEGLDGAICNTGIDNEGNAKCEVVVSNTGFDLDVGCDKTIVDLFLSSMPV